MRLTAGFSVPLSIDQTWVLLQDIARVAGWFPGARLEEADGDAYRGTVRVKLGPMLVDYKGTAAFVERDARAHRVVIEASGREQRGAGTAKATAVTELKAAGGATEVSVSIDLDVTGRPAQLGQSLMQDITERLVAEFATRMQADLSKKTTDEAPATSNDHASAVSEGGGDVLNLGQIAGRAMVRKAVRVAAVVFGALLVWRKLASRASR